MARSRTDPPLLALAALCDALATNVLARAALLQPACAAAGAARAAVSGSVAAPLLESVRASSSYLHHLAAALGGTPSEEDALAGASAALQV